jgi:hypothetical protein
MIDVFVLVIPERKEWHDKCFSSLLSKSIVVHKLEKAETINAGRLIGLAVGHSKYVAWVDDDDWIDPLYYEKALEVLEQNPHLSGVYCSEVKVFQGTEYDINPPIDEPWSYERQIETGLLVHNGIVFRREAIESCLSYIAVKDPTVLVEKFLPIATTWYGPLEHIPMLGYFWRQHQYQHCRTLNGGEYKEGIPIAISAAIEFVECFRRISPNSDIVQKIL